MVDLNLKLMVIQELTFQWEILYTHPQLFNLFFHINCLVGMNNNMARCKMEEGDPLALTVKDQRLLDIIKIMKPIGMLSKRIQL
jgi:hypothetical protein